MFANQRQEEIYKLVKKRGNVTVEELINTFNVSIETIRRDLILLESQNRIKRVHGGAISINSSKRYGRLSQRIDRNKKQKHELAVTAAELVQNGDIISIESGSTSIEFLEVIKERFSELTIVTNSIDVIERLGDKEGIKIFLSGGKFMPEENALYGETAVETIKGFCIAKAFIFPSGVSPENGVSDYSAELAEVQKAYISSADKKIIMADSSKLGTDAFIKICPLDSNCIIVTDSNAESEILEAFAQKDICVLK